jgi:hypothetical protein
LKLGTASGDSDGAACAGAASMAIVATITPITATLSLYVT